ncbi:MAG: DUF3991 and toprim domain-containing protein [Oscillospiraceae bacterium]|nr:DUF3991 and toprim domain-containing protein [Oscillospiraceae bacterium]
MTTKYNERVAQVKHLINIVDYAANLGYTVKMISNDTYTLTEHESIRITKSKNLYSRHSNQSKGGSIIDFVMEFTQYNDYPSAINHLIREIGIYDNEKPLFSSDKEESTKDTLVYEKESLQLNPKEKGLYKRAWAYLVQQRSIDPEIVTDAIKRNEIYQDDKGNVCFCGKDYDGIIKHAHARTTLSDNNYRGDMKGSDKAVSFSINLTKPISLPPTKLFVCEGAIDCLSLMTLTKIHELDIYDYGYLSLSGVSKKALEYHITKNTQIEIIYLCQDNDDSGNKSREDCRKALEKIGYKGVIYDKPPKKKDYNDDLVQYVNTLSQSTN